VGPSIKGGNNVTGRRGQHGRDIKLKKFKHKTDVGSRVEEAFEDISTVVRCREAGFPKMFMSNNLWAEIWHSPSHRRE
jgi:hypothetical protein